MGRDEPKGWHREDIKAALRKKHGSVERLSSSWGYHKSTVGWALVPGNRIPNIERRIAEELGVTPQGMDGLRALGPAASSPRCFTSGEPPRW